MDIQGVTVTAPVLPTSQAAPPPVESASTAEVTGADTIRLSVQVSTQVMDMALDSFETAANELISTMAATTGVGSNVDVTA